jgi:hypothetical protein
MPSMTATETTIPNKETDPGAGPGLRVVVFVSTILVIIMLAVMPLLTPWYIHAALDAADSAAWLGVEASVAHAMSDRSVEELVLGPGTFEFAGPDGEPFYDASERGHLGDARMLLWVFLIVGGVALIAVGAIFGRSSGARRQALWRTISRAGLSTAIVVLTLAILSVVAFGTLFTLFHQIFFPGGNFTFDPATQHLVQLYPFRFWQITSAVLGVLVLGLAVATWLLGRWRSGREPGSASR